MERFGRHDKEDQSMISAARLAFNLALPTEEAGQNYLSSPNREEQWIRKLYEKSIAGFYKTVLSLYGWHVYAGTKIEWPITQKSEGIDKILPSMQTDIILDPTDSRPRIVIDTKFNEIVEKGLYREESLRSEYIYQIYAYLRSQEEKGPKERNATGLLLHPAIKENYNEFVCIQNHKIKFATVDLTATTKEIRRRLLEIVEAI
jgi:5-methylcytosine-specific restriction enzyme subunit McrC